MADRLIVRCSHVAGGLGRKLIAGIVKVAHLVNPALHACITRSYALLVLLPLWNWEFTRYTCESLDSFMFDEREQVEGSEVRGQGYGCRV